MKDKGLREYINKIYSVISTLETFGGLKVSLKIFLKELGEDNSKQSKLTQKGADKIEN